MCAGAHASQGQLPTALLRIRSITMYFLRLCDTATKPDLTLRIMSHQHGDSYADEDGAADDFGFVTEAAAYGPAAADAYDD